MFVSGYMKEFLDLDKRDREILSILENIPRCPELKWQKNSKFPSRPLAQGFTN